MPRPDFVKDLIAANSRYTSDEYERLMDSAIHYVVALQEGGFSSFC